MSADAVVKSSQEQAVAGWIEYLNLLRFNELVAKLSAQDCNLEAAMRELANLREFIAHPEHIFGTILQKHGEIAEHVQVNFDNAEKLVQGLKAVHTFDGVGRTAMEDYIRNGQLVQSKFYQGVPGTLFAISNHLSDYPDFLNNGGCYDIAKNHFETLIKIYETGEKGLEFLSNSDGKMYEAIKEWEAENNVVFPNVVRPSLVTYDEVQLDRVADTVQAEEEKIQEADKEQRDKAAAEAAPSLQEGIKVAALSAAIEAGFSLGLGIYHKLHEGKKLHEFTEEDWKEIGLDTALGAVKGGVRGGGMYALTNFAGTPAPVANALISATYGVIAQANKLREGSISPLEFIDNSEVLCLDVSISALSAMVGQTLIPIPILGSVIGNAVGMFMYDIGKTFLTEKEQKLIEGCRKEIQEHQQALDNEYKTLLDMLEMQMSKFNSLIALAFDPDVNVRVKSSIERARLAGIADERILKNDDESESFFTSNEPFAF